MEPLAEPTEQKGVQMDLDKGNTCSGGSLCRGPYSKKLFFFSFYQE